MASPLRRAAGVIIPAFSAFLFLLATHAAWLTLPYFWDELGQFIPAALDLHRHGWWIPHSTLPNVHPPGVMAYLAVVWTLVGYSIPAARIAMLALAALGVVAAHRLGRILAPENPFLVPLFLFLTPWFWSQSMMAQLDMPAMVFATAALVAFLENRIWLAAIVSTVLVLTKETGLVVPAVFGFLLLVERRPRQALPFLLPALALGLWLAALYLGTGHPLGNREFAGYNLTYPLHPVRLASAFLRRAYQLLAGSFRWVGTLAIVWAIWRTRLFRSRAWRIALVVSLAQLIAVTALGGAVLERYLLPLLPIYYSGCALAFSALTPPWRILAPAALAVGLAASLFLNPPYPFPFENNLGWADFVRLQQDGARILESQYSEKTITTAWPLTDSLRRPEFGFVSQPLRVRELHGFESSVAARVENPEVFVLYCRMWDPPASILRFSSAIGFVSRYYGYEPPITGDELRSRFHLVRTARLERHGQWLEIYALAAHQSRPNFSTSERLATPPTL